MNMKSYAFIYLITTFFNLISLIKSDNTPKQFTYLQDQFFGEWHQQHIAEYGIACQPCIYKVTIYEQGAIMDLYHDDKWLDSHIINKKDNEIQLSFFSKQFEDTFVETGRQYHSWIKYELSTGLKWSFSFNFPKQGVIINDNNIQNTYMIPIIQTIFTIAFMISIPIKNKFAIQQISSKVIHRSNIISLLLSMQQLMVLMLYSFTLVCSYFIFSQGVPIKFVIYVVFMYPMAIIFVDFGFIFSCFTRKFAKIITKKTTHAIITIIIIIMFVLLYPLYICYFPKRQLYLYITTLPIIGQLLFSFRNKIKPSLQYMAHTYFSILLLMFYQKLMPLYNFEQLSITSMIIFIIIVTVLVFGGYALCDKLIKQSPINQSGSSTQMSDMKQATNEQLQKIDNIFTIS